MRRNKSAPRQFKTAYLSRLDAQSDSFEELAVPLFDHLRNFAHWLTQNREAAEDLVQETYAKALKGFPSFQLGLIFGVDVSRLAQHILDIAHWTESNNDCVS